MLRLREPRFRGSSSHAFSKVQFSREGAAAVSADAASFRIAKTR